MKQFYILLCAVLLSTLQLTPVLAISWTDTTAKENKQSEISSWPDGTMKLVNHALRNKGYHFFFSECQNDSYYFSYEIKLTDDVNTLLQTFSEIKAEKLIVNFDLAKTAEHADDSAVLFSLGNQEIIGEWYKHLTEVQPGVKAFGLHRYKDVPKAEPPTLFLYMANPAIDLDFLNVPVSLELTPINVEKIEDKDQKKLAKKINKFIDEHNAKHAKQKTSKKE